MGVKSLNMLSMCRIFAVFPVVQKDKKYVLSQIWVAYSILYYMAVIASQVYILYRDFTTNEGLNFNLVLDIGSEIYRIATILGSLFFLFKNIVGLNVFISKMTEVDGMLAQCGRVKTFKHINVCGWWLMVQLQVCILSELVFFNEKTGDAIFRVVDGASFHYILTGCVLQFSTFATQLDEKLASLNHTLDEFTHSYRNYGRGKVLLLLSDVHYHLTLTATELDNVYYRTYFLLISQAVWNLTTTAYKVSVCVYGHDFTMAAIETFWIGFWFVLVLTTVLPCAAARKKSKHFNEELSQILIRGYLFDDPNIEKRLQVHVEFDYIVKFSCGFFELDRTLIHSNKCWVLFKSSDSNSPQAAGAGRTATVNASSRFFQILGGVGSFTIILIQISQQQKS